jgi:hypothetical protein
VIKTKEEDNIMASFTAGTYSAKPGEVQRKLAPDRRGRSGVRKAGR